METVQEIMSRCGWKLESQKKHQKWLCPCGKHQFSASCTPSDDRGLKNAVSDLMNTGCTSLQEKEEKEEARNTRGLDKNTKYECHFCGIALEHSKHLYDWVLHGTIAACLMHQGVRDWHRRERAAEREKKHQASRG